MVLAAASLMGSGWLQASERTWRKGIEKMGLGPPRRHGWVLGQNLLGHPQGPGKGEILRY